MDALISAFHLDWKLILAQLVNFAIVFFVLYRYALKPLGRLMEERTQRISQGLDDAKRNEQLVKEAKEAYDLELARAKEEAQRLVLQMKEEVMTKRTLLMNEAKEEAQKLILDTRTQLQEEKNEVFKEARKELGELVVKTTEHILKEALTPEMRAKFSERAVKDLS